MVMVAVAAVAVEAVTSEVAERILVVRILAVRILVVRILVVRILVVRILVVRISGAAISAACRAATSLTSTPRTEQARPHWAAGPPGIMVPGTKGIGITAGTTGETTGGAAGSVDAAAAGGSVDPCSGPSSPATFLPLHFGLGASTTRSGLTDPGSCGMRCSGPVPSTPTARMVMFTAGMPMARHERASLPGTPLLKRAALYPTAQTWRNPAAASHPA